MTHEIHEAIGRILENGEVPPRVTNRLLLAAMLELANRQDNTDRLVRDLADRLTRIETFPSILGLLWRRPWQTMAIIISLFTLLALAYKAGGLSLF